MQREKTTIPGFPYFKTSPGARLSTLRIPGTPVFPSCITGDPVSSEVGWWELRRREREAVKPAPMAAPTAKQTAWMTVELGIAD